jgi:hypothetical protein
VLYPETLSKTLALVLRDASFVRTHAQFANTESRSESQELFEGIHGLRALHKQISHQQQVLATSHASTSASTRRFSTQSTAASATSLGASAGSHTSLPGHRNHGEIVVQTSKGTSLTICPPLGTMCGNLVAAKNTDKAASSIVNIFGGKKTKHRW